MDRVELRPWSREGKECVFHVSGFGPTGTCFDFTRCRLFYAVPAVFESLFLVSDEVYLVWLL